MEAGERITSPEGRAIGATEVLEAVARLHVPNMTYGDVVRASRKGW